MRRLFVAIDLPDTVVAQLTKVCHGLPEAHWTPEDQLHLTLRFIGESSDELYADIKDALKTLKLQHFELVLQGIGYFKPARQGHVLWTGLAESPQPLLALQTAIEQCLNTLGLAREKREFTPHVTLARLKTVSPVRLEAYVREFGTFQSIPFRAESFNLYRSQLTRKGAIHSVEASYPLWPKTTSVLEQKLLLYDHEKNTDQS